MHLLIVGSRLNNQPVARTRYSQSGGQKLKGGQENGASHTSTFKPLLGCSLGHLLIFHWPKQAIEPNPKSMGEGNKHL